MLPKMPAPKDVSSYEVIATQMCRELNPYFDGQYNDYVSKLIMQKENERRAKEGKTED